MQLDLSTVFYYSEESPSGLNWVNWNGQSNHSRRNSGDFAGNKARRKKGPSARWEVSYNNIVYAVHRIVYSLCHGVDIPDNMVVDHLNGDPWDNRIENLCLKTSADNIRNATMRSDNTSGFKGVVWCKVNKAWKANWHENLKPRSKSFSIKLHGCNAFNLAVAYRIMKIQEMISKGDNYTERHIYTGSVFDLKL